MVDSSIFGDGLPTGNITILCNGKKIAVRDHWNTKIFYNDKGQIVRKEFSDGMILHFEGECLVRKVYPDGNILHFKGERIVRKVFHDGRILFYEGRQYHEYWVKQVFPSGIIQYFKGKSGEERGVKQVLPSGIIQHLKGKPGKERIVRKVFPDGREEFPPWRNKIQSNETTHGPPRKRKRTEPSIKEEEKECTDILAGLLTKP